MFLVSVVVTHFLLLNIVLFLSSSVVTVPLLPQNVVLLRCYHRMLYCYVVTTECCICSVVTLGGVVVQLLHLGVAKLFRGNDLVMQQFSCH